MSILLSAICDDFEFLGNLSIPILEEPCEVLFLGTFQNTYYLLSNAPWKDKHRRTMGKEKENHIGKTFSKSINPGGNIPWFTLHTTPQQMPKPLFLRATYFWASQNGAFIICSFCKDMSYVNLGKKIVQFLIISFSMCAQSLAYHIN